MALALRVWGGSPARSAGAVNMLDAACFIGGRYQGGDGPSLRIVRRATHRRLWAVLWCDGEHAPLVDIMGDRSRDVLSIVGQLLLKGGGHHMHAVICSLASLLAYAAAWQVSPGT